MDEIFKAYDIRGKVGDQLNGDVVEKIGKAFADWLPQEGVVAVGYDMRPDSQDFAKALMSGITDQGYDVWDIGAVTTDMVYFSVGNYSLAGGAMVTASHNPGEYNGIKLVREEARGISLDTGLDKIRDAVINETSSFEVKTGKIYQKDVVDPWIDHVLAFINPATLSPYKIAIDTGNGMAGKIIPYIAARLPFEITPLYFELDGNFPNHPANPLEPANLEDLVSTVKQKKLDLGIAFDADGDRMAMVDGNGEIVSGTLLSCMLAEYFLQEAPGAVMLHNAIMGRAFSETVLANDGKPIRTRVGHSFIKQEMRKHDALFGAEHSMHYYFKENWRADSGLIAAIIALAALSETGWTLAQYASKFKRYVSIPETNFVVKDKQAVIDKISKEFADGKRDTLDGLTVNYENSWFNVRPSNTEPLLRLNAEALTKEELDALVRRVKTAGDLNSQ